MSHPLDICLQWPPAGLGGCRICGGDWGPFPKGGAICQGVLGRAREFAAGRGRGPAISPFEQLKKALRSLARGRQISDLAVQWVLDNFRRARRVRVDHCGAILGLRGIRLRLPDDDRKRAGGAVFVVQMPNGDPAVVVRRPGSGGVAMPWEGTAA